MENKDYFITNVPTTFPFSTYYIFRLSQWRQRSSATEWTNCWVGTLKRPMMCWRGGKLWSILRYKEDLVSGSPPKKFANNVWWPLHWFMKFSGYRKLRKNISGSKRFKMVAPHQRQNRAATPGWWPWTGTQTPSSGTPTSDPSGQTSER